MKNHSTIAIAIASLSVICSCGNGNSWSIDGVVDGSDSTTLYLEGLGYNGWYVIDSVVLTDDGDFEFERPIVGYPEIFRLKANERMVYFPIDSIESLSFSGNAAALDSAYTLTGSASAEMLMSVDKKIADATKKGGEIAVATDSVLKRELSEIILGDDKGLVSYYIVNKRVGNTLIFNPADKKDIRIIGAVANKFMQQRPNDPRAKSLEKLFLENRRVSTLSEKESIPVAHTALFDITLYDNKGKLQSLKEVASHGKITVLNFTIYDNEASPAFNIALNKVYEANKDKLEIYQVSVDENESLWKESAENLPWITVYNSKVDGAQNLLNYNVTLLPMSFIIDCNGELVERVDDVTVLEKALKKYL